MLMFKPLTQLYTRHSYVKPLTQVRICMYMFKPLAQLLKVSKPLSASYTHVQVMDITMQTSSRHLQSGEKKLSPQVKLCIMWYNVTQTDIQKKAIQKRSIDNFKHNVYLIMTYVRLTKYLSPIWTELSPPPPPRNGCKCKNAMRHILWEKKMLTSVQNLSRPLLSAKLARRYLGRQWMWHRAEFMCTNHILRRRLWWATMWFQLRMFFFFFCTL